jgi:short-subunit dehydrogenase
MKLKNKIAVVAGASGGIGRELSRELASEGAEMVLVARRAKVLNALKRDIEKTGGKASVFTSDLTDPKSVSDLASEIRKKYSNIDILVNAVGVGVYKNFEELDFEDWNRSFNANVDAAFLLIQKLMPLLKKAEEAYVISTGSGMGKIAVKNRSAYCASKFALRGLMLSLAKEYGDTNIKFVLLTIGSVLTSFGPLTVEGKKEKQEKGKKYLDPKWLANHIVIKIRHDTLEPETPIYPKHYFEESKKGRT